MNIFLVALSLAVAPLSLQAQVSSASRPAPGWLDAADLASLTEGRGAGMARAAEAHGLPGPKHVLELADALELSAKQREQMHALMVAMHAQAVAQGRAVLAAESALDAELARQAPDAAQVARLSEAVGIARGQLRNVHLSTHVAAAPLLSVAQRNRYQQLRKQAAG